MLWIVCLLLLIMLIFWYYTHEISRTTNSKELTEFEERIAQWYPFGDDEFMIRHTGDYLSWFKKNPYYYVCRRDNKVVASIAAVLRGDAWYICDMKVDPEYRSQGLMSRFNAKMIWMYFIAPRCYGISMEPNLIMEKLAKKYHVKPAGRLAIYSMKYEELPMGVLSKKFKKIKCVESSKKLILRSTGEPVPIRHLTNKGSKVKPGFTYYFCLLTTDPLINELPTPQSYATIYAYGMDGHDWSTITTDMI